MNRFFIKREGEFDYETIRVMSLGLNLALETFTRGRTNFYII